MGKKQPQQVQINWAESHLEEQIRDLIKEIASNADNAPDLHSEDSIFFGNDKEGYLLLDGQNSKKYREVVGLAFEKICSSTLISRSFLVEWLNNSILEVIDIEKRRENLPLDQRLDQAIKQLKELFRQRPSEYILYYPISGLSHPGLPFKVGKVEFFVFGECTLEEIELQSSEETSNFNTPELFGTTYAKISVTAIDRDAAEEIALDELHKIIDILNFYTTFIPFASGCYLYLPNESSGKVIFYAIRQPDKESSSMFGEKTIGPFPNISFQMLLKADNDYNVNFLNVCHFLSQDVYPFQEKLLGAMQWAGRAVVSEALKQREQAFLFYMIALESILMVGNEKDEVKYQFCIRLAHLLGKRGPFRSEIVKRAGKLYDVRSAIVHTGKHEEVSKGYLSWIRFMTRNCLIRLLRDEPFSSMKINDDLKKWFNDNILGVNPGLSSLAPNE